MLSKVYIQDGKIINVGEWDYGFVDIVVNQKEIEIAIGNNEEFIPEPIIQTSVEFPMPDGLEEVVMDIEYFGDKHGWQEVGFKPEVEISIEKRIKNAEDLINIILLGGL